LATRPQWLRHGRRPAHVRLLAALTLVATLRGVLSFAAPASPHAPTMVFLGIAISATVLGLAVWFSSCAWCERITPMIGLACVGLVIAVAATGTGAAGASIGYVWLNLYVASGIAKMGITELTIAVWPWLLTMLMFLGVVTYVPEISLWLPRVLGML